MPFWPGGILVGNGWPRRLFPPVPEDPADISDSGASEVVP